MHKPFTKDKKGFTIIEVLIVLAIAGLILLIVFLAVPALQRNSRNTAMKTDVSNVLGGVSEFVGNNDGKMPTSITGTGDITMTNGAISQTTKVRGSTSVTYATTAVTSLPTGRDIVVHIGGKCSSTGTATVAGTSRSVAALYQIETSGGNVLKCQES